MLLFSKYSDKFSERGVVCVDMEATAIMALSEFRKIGVAILIVISDLIWGDRWIKGWGEEKTY